MSESPRFEIFQGKDAKNYWHLKGANGEVILSGRGYATKSETVKKEEPELSDAEGTNDECNNKPKNLQEEGSLGAGEEGSLAR